MEPEIGGRDQSLGGMGKRLLQWVGDGEEQATEGISPPPPMGRGEGQCSEGGEVTAVGGGVKSNEELGGLRSEEGRGQAVVPPPVSCSGSRLVGFPQTSSEQNGCQACLSPWSQEEDGLSGQLGPHRKPPRQGPPLAPKRTFLLFPDANKSG